LVLYHNDADGFCSAWVASKHLPPDTEFRAVQYGDLAPLTEEVEGRRVFLLDFSFPLPILQRLDGEAEILTVLDHHKTSKLDVESLEGGFHDLNSSGAMMTWRFFYQTDRAPPDSCAPALVQYVQDRDLWRFWMEESEAVNAYISACPFDFGFWDLLSHDMEERLPLVVSKGEAILESQQRMVERMAARAVPVRLPVRLPKHSRDWPETIMVPCCNATVLQSELGQHLAVGHPCSVTWMHDGSKYIVNLRSAPEGVDVSEIAKGHGGGGHAHAAGFGCTRLPWDGGAA
jgi:oligoribonuclease NrnB/cAMP/cGMP phosphodiesterase (DHH superfamily)